MTIQRLELLILATRRSAVSHTVIFFGWVRTAIYVLTGVLLCARPAHAIPYEVFIDVDDEGDLQDLLAAGTIQQETYDELLDLLYRGVDISRAERSDLYALPNLTFDDVDAIIAYRDLQKGRIKDPAELVAAGALSEEKLLAISSFIIVREAGENPLAARGWIRAVTRATWHDFDPFEPQDPFIPPLALRARVIAMRYLTAGIAFTNTRLDIGAPVYDPNRGALIAEARSNQVHVPKAFVKWETDDMTAIAGTFRAGFGQRLVFDNSQNYSPNGLYLDDQLTYGTDLSTACKESAGELLVSPCTGRAGGEYVTPDFGWRDGLLGVAAGAKHLELDQGWLQGFAWASVSRRSIYQYELVDAGKCDDPRDDTNPDCAAPVVFVKPKGNLLTPTTRHSFATLPNVFQERLAGMNVGYFSDRRNAVGLTAYGAMEENLIAGIDLDVQEWSRLPNGKRFGAVGANFSFGREWLDLFGEAALSFDKMKPDPTLVDASGNRLSEARGGGGPAVVVRATATRKKEELEVVGRYYSTDFLNPYARPISESDEFEGQRARDEAGLRTRYIRTTKEFQIRALLDIWLNPSTKPKPTMMDPDPSFLPPPKIDTFVRVNVKTTPWLWLGLWERYQDKDLTRGGGDQCFEISNETDDETGEPIPCGGRQLSTTIRGQYIPNKIVSATLQVEHQLVDDNTRKDPLGNPKTNFRQDVAIWAVGYYRPSRDVRIRGRLRYLDEAIDDNTVLERSLAGVVDVASRVREKDTVRVRLDGKLWLDNRKSTAERYPNPGRINGKPLELSLWLFYEAKL